MKNVEKPTNDEGGHEEVSLTPKTRVEVERRVREKEREGMREKSYDIVNTTCTTHVH